MESVLEIAVGPLPRHARGRRRRCARCAGRWPRSPARHGLRIGSAGTHPFALLGGPADLRARALPRARRGAALRRAPGAHLRAARARRDRRSREGDPRRQRHARARARSCSRCRPTRRSGARDATGLASTRMPIFRAFPRVGIPPLLRGLGRLREADRASWSRRASIEDYTWLWYDVRPHPNLGTVEIRAMDAQTRVEHTLGARRADPGDGQGAGRALRRRASKLAHFPHEMLDENKWLAARHGLDGELVDLPERRRVPTQGPRPAARTTACASTRRTSARPPSSRASRTCSSAATAPSGSAWSTRRTRTTPRSCARSSRRRRA